MDSRRERRAAVVGTYDAGAETPFSLFSAVLSFLAFSDLVGSVGRWGLALGARAVSKIMNAGGLDAWLLVRVCLCVWVCMPACYCILRAAFAYASVWNGVCTVPFGVLMASVGVADDGLNGSRVYS